MLLPGYSDKFAYQNGLLDNRIPFEDLKAIAHVNDLAAEHFDDADFSKKIRGKRQMIDRYLAREAMRSVTMEGKGDQFLSEQLRRPLRR